MNVPVGPHNAKVIGTFNVDGFTMSGKMQFDVAAKKLKITAAAKCNSSMSAMGTVNETASVTSLVDFGAWTATVDAKGSFTKNGVTQTTDKCVPSMSLPNKQSSAVVSMYMSKQMLTQMAMMANMQINAIPHTTADGVATFSKSQYGDSVTFKMKTDGTPVSVSVTSPGRGHFSLTFSNWATSSGDMTAPTCTSTEVDELGWNFVGLAEVTNFVRDHPFVREAADETTDMLVGSGDDSSDFSTLAAIFFVAGMTGAAVVMVMSKISAKKNKASLLLDEV